MKLKRTCLSFALLFCISACGLKGDLYLPEDAPQAVNTVSLEKEKMPESEASSLSVSTVENAQSLKVEKDDKQPL